MAWVEHSDFHDSGRRLGENLRGRKGGSRRSRLRGHRRRDGPCGGGGGGGGPWDAWDGRWNSGRDGLLGKLTMVVKDHGDGNRNDGRHGRKNGEQPLRKRRLGLRLRYGRRGRYGRQDVA